MQIKINRFRFLNSIVAMLVVFCVAAFPSPLPGQELNTIQRENANEGSIDWQLTRVRLDRSDGCRSPAIEGYCDKQSVSAGDSLQIMVSTQPAEQFQIEIFRTGYYGGRGARLMETLGPFQGQPQPVPTPNDRALHECRWEPAVEFMIPEDWPSGVYLGRLTTLPPKEDQRPYWQSYVIFIVRDDRPADILFQCSDNTWQAYNGWPYKSSLYTHPKGGQGPWADVSFDRPYGREAQYTSIVNDPLSFGSGGYLTFEFPLAYWLEQQGYDVSYCSNSDLITPERGLKCKAFLSVGHDEYWDIRQYNSVVAMRDAGVNLLFLSGNSVCWVTPFKPSSDGQPNRVIFRGGPFGGKHTWAVQREQNHGPFPERGPDEGYLMGARNLSPVNGGGDWICAKPEHWIFAGTSMKRGDRIPGLIGWEYHGDPPQDLPGLEVVAQGTARGRQSLPVDGNDLSRTEGKLCVQRCDHFLVARPQFTTRPHASMVSLEPTARTRSASTTNHAQPARSSHPRIEMLRQQNLGHRSIPRSQSPHLPAWYRGVA